MKNTKHTSAFSLIEALATVAIIGIITFLALPNVVRAREDAEINMAIARAEALNMSIASLVQSRGFGDETLNAGWAAATQAQKYGYLVNYLAYAPAAISDFVPAGYDVNFPPALTRPLKKVELVIPGGNEDGTDLPVSY